MSTLKKFLFIVFVLPLLANEKNTHVQQSQALTKYISENNFQPDLDLNLIDLPIIPTLDIVYARGTNTIIAPLSPATREMTFSDAKHLLNRSVVGTTIDELNTFLEFEISTGVDYLLRAVNEPSPPGEWVDDPFPPNYVDLTPEQKDSLISAYISQTRELMNWWTDRFFYHELSIEEEMVYFWHDHFATSAEGIPYAPAMYHQNKLLRQYALGNFKTLVNEMVIDPAMLLWLNNNENTANSVNENFGRELLELFTLGEGNYTQNDVYEGARGLTGYVTNGLDTYFLVDRFDDGIKTFLGQTGNFNAADIIDIIFEQDQTAYFICDKLYRWFIYDIPNEEIIEELAQIMRDNNYEIKPVMVALLNSEHFFDENFRGAKYKTPIHHTLSSLKLLNVDVNEPIEFEYTLKQVTQYLWDIQGGVILYPPDVSGWPGYRNWINTYTLPWRKTYTNYIIYGALGGFHPDLVNLTSQIPNGQTDPEALMEYLYDHFYAIEPSELTKQQLLNDLLDGADPFEWHLLYYEGALERLYVVVGQMMKLSEYQLK
ncbi:MAG: DUF1800 domain-containing protein [Candidatus Marinimicrobia bacterium]|nr:DUF1800 domain-containing protein [Candidatus Neomarinimicrobiota bacterium]